MTPKPAERGMVLINVLLMVALASGILVLMAVAQESSLDRSIRLRDAAAADAAIRGGELSAVAALRRDAAKAPEADTLAEPWAQIGDESVPIQGGRFQLAIADAQAKLNLNGIGLNDVGTMRTFTLVSQALSLPPETFGKIVAFLKGARQISRLDQLELAGVDPATVAQLAQLCTVLPGITKINVNTASEGLLIALTGDPVAGRVLATRRGRQGFLNRDDFALARTPMPAIAGYTSDLFWVRARVTIRGLAREETALLRRSRTKAGPAVTPIARWIGRAAPLDAPALAVR